MARQREGFCKLQNVAFSMGQRIKSKLHRFLPDLDPFTMEVVLETAPRTHALTLKNFFHRYLMGKAAIGVTIPVS